MPEKKPDFEPIKRGVFDRTQTGRNPQLDAQNQKSDVKPEQSSQKSGGKGLKVSKISLKSGGKKKKGGKDKDESGNSQNVEPPPELDAQLPGSGSDKRGNGKCQLICGKLITFKKCCYSIDLTSGCFIIAIVSMIAGITHMVYKVEDIDSGHSSGMLLDIADAFTLTMGILLLTGIQQNHKYISVIVLAYLGTTFLITVTTLTMKAVAIVKARLGCSPKLGYKITEFCDPDAKELYWIYCMCAYVTLEFYFLLIVASYVINTYFKSLVK